ncbi:MAG TPA: DUF4214 domain-containing protein, partial [Pyrinomonadaceae bacterium]|nr:DUF4214 domain-containing protein [Pyrinomonadaceae bacterium]
MKYTPRLTPARAAAAFVTLLLLAAAPPAPAQTETFEPFALRADMTDVRVWTSGERTHARVVLTFPMGGFRVTDVGPVRRQGNDVSVDFTIDRWTGPVTQALVVREFFFDLGALPSEPGTFTFTVKSRGANVKSVAFDPRQVVEHWEEASIERVLLGVWTTGGVTFASAELWFPDDGYRVAEWHAPERVGNDFVSRVRLERWTGRSSVLVFKREKRLFVLGQLPADESFTFSVQFSDGARQTSRPFTPAGTKSVFANPLDDPAFFVRQHYLDFLGREPDEAGLNHWTNEITSCNADAACVELKRVNVSAAFFLSIESQRTGYFFYRLHKAALGSMPRLADYRAAQQTLGRGVVVRQLGWEERLDANRRAFVAQWISGGEFAARYGGLSNADYVDTLLATAGLKAESVGRDALVAGLDSGAETRASVLLKVADDPELDRREKNRAFVLMEYFGYLRRNPSDAPEANLNYAGWNFWLGKLNEFNGNFVQA